MVIFVKRVTKRRTRRLMGLKFKCSRCKTEFKADLVPDCTFEYDHVLIGPEKDLVGAFVKIQTMCPDCGKILNYEKRIDLYDKNGVFIE